jgi:hypothetical protein
MNQEVDEYCYLGIKLCGCAVVIMADIKGHEKDLAKSIASCIKEGLKVERALTKYAKEKFKKCMCGEEDKLQQKLI